MVTLVSPGTPALTLPKYTAAPFNSPQVALGDAVTMVRLRGAGQDLPTTFGQSFREGDLAPGDTLAGRTIRGEIPLQMDVKATHPDGSVRHAIISAMVQDLPRDTDMWLIRSDKRPPVSWVVGSILDDYRVVLVHDGVTYTAEPGSGKARGWLAGHVAQEFIHNEPLMTAERVPHPFLMAQFGVRDFANNSKVDITLEHTKAYATNGTFTPKVTAAVPNPATVAAQVDITYDVTILVTGEVRYQKTGLVHFPCSRWKKTFWLKGEPNIHVEHFTPYLIDTRAVSSYDQRVTISNSYLDGLIASLNGPDFEPMGRGRYLADMSAPGGRPEIALAPDTHPAYILSRDPRAYKAMLRCVDQAGSFGSHRRDDQGRPLDVLHYPRATLLGQLGDSLNTATGQREKLPPVATSSTLLAQDSSHMPGYPYIPYLLSGDFYYKEELEFWCNWSIYQTNPGYRDGARAVMTIGQLRGQGWTLRTLAECASIIPDDDPMKSAFNFWLANTAEKYVADNATPGAKYYSPLGAMITEQAIAYPSGVGIALAPWQNDFFASAVGYALDLTGLPALRKLAEWSAMFAIGRMTAPGFCWIDATTYNLQMRDTKTSAIYTDFTTIYEKTFAGTPRLTTGCNTPERLAYMNSVRKMPSPPMVLGEMVGYAGETTGFVANMQPALAYAVDVIPDREAAALAWARFDGRANQPKYGTGPQFAIVPRAYLQAVQIPAPPPAPEPPTPPGDVLIKREIELSVKEWESVDARGADWLRQLIRLVG